MPVERPWHPNDPIRRRDSMTRGKSFIIHQRLTGLEIMAHFTFGIPDPVNQFFCCQSDACGFFRSLQEILATRPEYLKNHWSYPVTFYTGIAHSHILGQYFNQLQQPRQGIAVPWSL